MHTPSENPKKQIILYPMSPPIPWPHPLASILSVDLYAHIASRRATIFHACSPHPFPATPLHPRRPQPSASSLIPSVFFSPATPLHTRRPQPSAQPSSLIPSTFFSPPIFRHSLHARRRQPSAAVRAAKLAHPQRLLLPTHFPPTPLHPRRPQPSAQPNSLIPSHPLAPTHFQPLPCTHAVRSRPRSQARSSPAAFFLHPFPATPLHPSRWQPSGRPQRLLLPISSHSLAPTPSAAIRAAKLAHRPAPSSPQPHPQHLLLPTHFQPPPCTHAVRVRAAKPLIPSTFVSPPIFRHSLAPTASAAVRAAKLAHPQRFFFVHPFPPTPLTQAVRSRLRSQARSSPAASSPHPFPATPLHPRCPQPPAQPNSLIPSGFFPFPPTPFWFKLASIYNSY